MIPLAKIMIELKAFSRVRETEKRSRRMAWQNVSLTRHSIRHSSVVVVVYRYIHSKLCVKDIFMNIRLKLFPLLLFLLCLFYWIWFWLWKMPKDDICSMHIVCSHCLVVAFFTVVKFLRSKWGKKSLNFKLLQRGVTVYTHTLRR